METLKRLWMIIASAYILLFFSEYYFLNEEPAIGLVETLTTNPVGLVFLIEFIIMYAFFSYSMLIALQKFKVRNIWGLILAGALFGWWTEGIVIPIYYEALPYSIFWPSIGWHVIVDVLLGWYLVRKVLHMNKPLYTVLLSSALGIFWGIWATWFWGEGLSPIAPTDFVIYSFFTVFLLIIAYWSIDSFNPVKMAISKLEIILFAVFSIFCFITIILSLGILPILYFVPMVAITCLALWIGGKSEKRDSLFDGFEVKTKKWQYPILLLIPLTSSIVYNNIYKSKLDTGFTELIPLALLVAAVPLYLIAMVKVAFKTR
ncbi:hypothetical protein F8154_13655 [Alkaliphilus pronyensis]|uniref:Uncharacterized protein n=1 Tax=Alkaliphilus pronyensis TaxID=1482732 RepID=A0A6I0F4V4_9FIRM|nr:hypothetical protein [Alkaliphilus pronyensis]KAB3530669.1 hypothetical protein F8154_13655 [Alkaliphilus pronyensis]